MGVAPYELGRLTTEELKQLVEGERPVAVMVPVGAVEPHGPHLPLDTDVIISQAASARAVRLLQARGVVGLVAPAVPYGVTECARAFAGAVSVRREAIIQYLRSIVQSILNAGVMHVCLVNSHLEPEHDAAVRDAADGVGRVSVASPLTRRWAKTLSDEFKSGACHAGAYETSIIMAAEPERVRDAVRASLPEVPVSLSQKLNAGVTDFKDMGLERAYAGAPAAATPEHGREQIDRLATMVATEILEALGMDPA